MADQKTTR